jgi:hypothetical protein
MECGPNIYVVKSKIGLIASYMEKSKDIILYFSDRRCPDANNIRDRLTDSILLLGFRENYNGIRCDEG